MYIYIYILQRLKNIGLVTGPGGFFGDKAWSRIGGLATNLHCDKPIQDYSALHRGPRQGFVTEGPRQRYVTEGGGGGTATNPSRITAIYVYILRVCIYIYISYIILHMYYIYVCTLYNCHSNSQKGRDHQQVARDWDSARPQSSEP